MGGRAPGRAGGERSRLIIVINAEPERYLLIAKSHQVIELIMFSEYIGAALRRA